MPPRDGYHHFTACRIADSMRTSVLPGFISPNQQHPDRTPHGDLQRAGPIRSAISPDDGLFTSSDPFPRRAQIGRASSTFHTRIHTTETVTTCTHRRRTTYNGPVFCEMSRERNRTEPSFPPCGDREISVGDLSFLSFLSRSSAVKIAISVAFLS